MSSNTKDQEFVEYVVRAIVSKPDAVRTERSVDEMGVLLTLHVDQADMGYVIGRSGQTARAIRTLLRVIGAQNNARINFKIADQEGGRERKNNVDASMVNDLKI